MCVLGGAAGSSRLRDGKESVVWFWWSWRNCQLKDGSNYQIVARKLSFGSAPVSAGAPERAVER